jgi:hypothetical protein
MYDGEYAIKIMDDISQYITNKAVDYPLSLNLNGTLLGSKLCRITMFG